ncbi:asparagine synthase (glutamine-hydrolyzing) [Kitasatospora sp. NPDC058048]|uniref:asparagine synthase (glutamine-hydrolyzing) n=1 Tax=Kitasatospora sp. NPDC058048 TaxID=3346313 RepID=UPI0036D7C573
MSGLAGLVSRSGDVREQARLVQEFTDTLTHRGPRRGGTWLARHAGLGHRQFHTGPRNDVPQPWFPPELDPAPAVIAFSGELLNPGPLHTALTARGHRIRNGSDAELVLRAYLEWGADAADRLVGGYAAAIWDARTEELVLIRDRLGVEPLYWAELPDGSLAFGSEPKALLAAGLPAEVDANGLVDVLTVALKRPGDAVYRGLHEVRPGWLLVAGPNGVRHRRYWAPEAAEHTDDEATTVRRVRALLADTVRRQSADTGVKPGALLSGGLDSSAIVGLAAAGGDKIATYSVDFAGSETDFKADALHVSRDAPYVRAVVDHVGTRHTEILLDAPSLLDHLGATLRARDLPGVGDLDVSLHLLFREVRGHAEVVLSGEGADDVFGGFPWFTAEADRPTANFPWSAGITDRSGMLSAELRRHLDVDAEVAARYGEALAEVPRLAGESGADRRLREAFHLQLTRFLPFLLDRKDRMSFAAGLLVRLPFTDHRLVEYVWNTPWALKRLGGQEKGLLREAVADLLPAEVVRRQKSGFPFGQSPEYLEAVREAVRALLADRDSPALPLLNADALRAQVDGGGWHTGTFTPPPWLPRALLLDAWLRTYGVRVVL